MSLKRFGQSLAVIIVLTAGVPAVLAARSSQSQAATVDINRASQSELEALPGIGAVTARKIIDHRPYSSVGDLSRAGVSARTLDKISGMVTVGRAAYDQRPSQRDDTRQSRGNQSSSSGGLVDLNTASLHDLEALPAIGFIAARKIVSGRPYNSVDDLRRAGISASAVAKIRGRVTVSGLQRRPTERSQRESFPSREQTAPAQQTEPPSQRADDRASPAQPRDRSTTVAPRSGSGMVWVNKDTKIFHREGDHWYGNTMHGAYMTEQDALSAGYRESKQKIKQ